MGVIIPQVVTEDRAGGSQIVEGSLKFDSSKKTYLTRTPGSAGNRTTWTWSGWVKRTRLGNGSSQSATIFVASDYTANTTQFYFEADNTLYFYDYQSAAYIANLRTTQVFRDVSAWAHFMVVFDSNNGTSGDRVRIYVNGSRITNFSTATYPNSGATTRWNNTVANEIASSSNTYATDIMLSNCYLIDGQALDPSYFGYTDPLTNTWRPKRYTGTYGTNGFYLPLDGNTPIGQDSSGNNNNWTPVNFGGSNTLEKATGALPILNTDGGGKVARVGVRTDSNASSLVLALPLVGIKSDFSNAINGGTSNKTITANGNAAASSTQSNFYGGSFYFDGTGDWLSIGTSSDLSIGTSDNFTFEAFIYPTAVSDTTPFGIGNNAGFAYRIISGSPYLYIGAVGGILNTGTISANKWTHIAVTRNSGTLYSFIDGVLVGSVANTSSFSGTQENFVGAANLTGAGSPGYTFTGYIQDVRFYKGLAKYTQNFIPASTDPDILPDTPSGVAYSSNVALVPSTDGAVALDGSGDYLSIASGLTDFQFGTGDFTLEAYINKSANGTDGYDGVAQLGPGAPNAANGWYWETSSSRGVYFQINGVNVSSNTWVNDGRWHHVAITRSSGTVYIFIDGILQTSGSLSTTVPTSGSALEIGRSYNGTSQYSFNGFISNFHVVKGTALYTSNFTPPTGPINSVANTKLLCCQENKFPVVGYTTTTATGALPILNTNPTGTTTTGGVASDSSSSTIVLALSLLNNSSDSSATIKGSGSAKTFTATGNAAASSTQSKYYGGSFYFDGSGDSLTTTTSTDFAIKQSDFTIEMWVYPTTAKDGNVLLSLGTGMSALYWTFGINASNGFYFGSGTGAWQWETNGDPGTTKTSNGLVPTNTWTHIAAVRSGTSLLYFCNGLLVKTITSFPFGSATQGGTFYVGTYFADANNDGSWYQGYIQDIRIYKGTAKYTSNFNPVGNFDRPSAAVSPSQILPFGNATASNFNPFTTNINTQRGKQSGYCTLNPLDDQGNTLSNGNLVVSRTTSSWCNTKSNISVSSGKWYYEATVVANGGGNYQIVGVFRSDVAFPAVGANGYMTFSASGWGVQTDGYVSNNNSFTSLVGAASVGDTLMIAFDIDNTRIWFGRNGIWYGNPATGSGAQFTNLTSPLSPAISLYATQTSSLNFGQKPFKFPPPAGFQPLALANTPRPTIVRPDQYVGVTTYTGNGGTQSINVGWKSDFVWVKGRNQAYGHRLLDTVRGATNALASSSTAAEFVESSGVTSFNNTGFNLGSNVSYNENTTTYVAWAWKAGGNSNTYNINDIGYSTASAAGLTAGTITPTGASVNTKSGFSIIGYTGTGTSPVSISHGLNSSPTFLIFKDRDSAVNWQVWTTAVNSNGTLIEGLNTAAAGTTPWTYISTTSSLIQFNSGNTAQTSNGKRFICYAWHDVPGFSRFGSFSGNNSTDGVYVSLGFRPKFLIVKCIQDIAGDVEHWIIRDSTRSTYNPANANLYANLGNAEDDASGFSGSLDLLSNGFKMRGTYGGINASATYIYAAWAETPSFNLYGGQANAR